MSERYSLTKVLKTPTPQIIAEMEDLEKWAQGRVLDKHLQLLELDRSLHEDADLTTMGLFWEGRTPPECPQDIWQNYHYHLKIKMDMLRDRAMCMKRCNTKTRIIKQRDGNGYGVEELDEPIDAYQTKYTAYVRMLDDGLEVKETELAPWRHMVNQYRQRMSVKALRGEAAAAPGAVPSSAMVDQELYEEMKKQAKQAQIAEQNTKALEAKAEVEKNAKATKKRNGKKAAKNS